MSSNRPGRRLDRLEDALRILPSDVGPGEGDATGARSTRSSTPSPIPRPIGRIPIIVGGRGSRTIKLAGHTRMVSTWSAPRISASTSISFEQSAVEAGRDPDALEVSVLDTPLARRSIESDVAAMVEANRGRMDASVFAATHNAGTVGDHVERLRHAGGLRGRGRLRVAGGSHLTGGGCRLEAGRRSAGLRPARINPARSTHWLNSGGHWWSWSPRALRA